MGNWLTRNQAQELISAASKNSLRGRRDGAILGLLLGCGLRRSEVVGLNLDQLQSREGHWVIVNLVGKGGRYLCRSGARHLSMHGSGIRE
jgi:site-specific recombinase XerD